MKKTIKFFTLATLIPASCLGGIKGSDYIAKIYNTNDEINSHEDSMMDTKDIKENPNSDAVLTTLEELSDETEKDKNEAEVDDNNAIENEAKVDESDTDTISINYTETFGEISENLNEALDLLESIFDDLNDGEINSSENDAITLKCDELNAIIINLKNETHEIKCLVDPNSCDDENGDTKIFFEVIEKLEHRIDALQSAFLSLNNANNFAPYFSFYNNPYANVYGYNYRFYRAPNMENQTDENSDAKLPDTEENESVASSEKTKLGDVNLTSNIDSYGPQNRNIDSFFNTALIDDNMYGFPYGGNFAVPYQYGMGDINGYGYNSNNGYRNPNIENQNNKNTQNNNTNVDTMDNAKDKLTEPPKKIKFGKNIDTYLDKSISGNIGSLNGMSVTDYLRAKINNIFKKQKPKNSDIKEYVDKFVDKNYGEINENNNDLKLDFFKDKLPEIKAIPKEKTRKY